MAKKKKVEEQQPTITTVVVESCNKDVPRHYIVCCVGGSVFRSKKPVVEGKAYEVSVPTALESDPQHDDKGPFGIFTGPLSLRSGSVSTTEGKR